MANSMSLLTLARMMQGIGAAGLMSVNTALIRYIMPRAKLGGAIGILGGAIGINALVVAMAATVGPTLSGGDSIRSLLAVAVCHQSAPWPCSYLALQLFCWQCAVYRITIVASSLLTDGVSALLSALMIGFGITAIESGITAIESIVI
ncbi:MAG: hypothetical protein ACR5LF_11340 [Symbiopectobacterium sp.]